MSDGDRIRMDRSLDEIAAEMHSGESFGRGYEERETNPADSRGRDARRSRRYAPYSPGGGGGGRDSGRGEREERGGARQQQQQSQQYQKGGGRNCRVFVGNLHYSTTWQALKDHMRRVGAIIRCDIFRSSDGSSRGMGVVEYSEPADADRALEELNELELEGRRLFLRKDMTPDDRDRTYAPQSSRGGRPYRNPSCTVVASNLHYSVTWQKLKDIFRVAGSIINVEILKDREGKSRGVGEVQFETTQQALGALALFHGQILCDRSMVVKMDPRSPIKPDPLKVKLSATGIPNIGHAHHHHRGGGGDEGGLLMSSLALKGLKDSGGGNPGMGDRGRESGRYSDFDSRKRGGSYSDSYHRESRRRSYDSRSPSPPPQSHHGNSGYRHGDNGGYDRDRGKYDRYESSYDQPQMESRWHGNNKGSPPSRRYSHSESSGYRESGGYGEDRGTSNYSRRGDSSSSGGRGSHREGRGHGGGGSGRPQGQPPVEPEMNRKIFIRNINYEISWQKLKDIFRRAGNVIHADILKNAEGRSRGLGVVMFERPEDATRAIELFDDEEVEGRRLVVQYDTVEPR